jgi:hypothetical protein
MVNTNMLRAIKSRIVDQHDFERWIDDSSHRISEETFRITIPVRGIHARMLATTLPDLNTLDREALQALLVAEHEERMATHARLQSRESEIEHLKLLLSQLRRMQFGRKSEKLERQIEQLVLV